jgi:hypothetical protein
MSSDSMHTEQPLGLTVHTLPQASSEIEGAGTRTRGGRLKMLLLLVICASPVLASYFTYYVIRPEGRRNFGVLIDPQRTLPDVVVQTLDGKSVRLPELKGQWMLISVASGACDAACSQHLYLQRQLREGLGKEKDRVDWVWLVRDDLAVSEALQPALKEATVLRMPAAAIASWLEPQTGKNLNAHLYLVDPLGNWMMRFPADVDPQTAPQVKRDLDRLLRASVSWDKAGR